MGLRVGLHDINKRKIECPCWESNPIFRPSSHLLNHAWSYPGTFIVQYGLNIFDIKLRNLNADLTVGTAELSGHKKMYKVVLLFLQASNAKVPLEWLAMCDQL